MMNKKLIALIVAIATINVSTFALFDDVLRGTGRVAEGVVSAPADVASGGRTWDERHERWESQDEDRREREEDTRQREKNRRQQRRENRRNARSRE